MSTSDCKSLLTARFPGTAAKEWKREIKYLNVSGYEIRRFSHPVSGVVYVHEDYEEISASDASLQFCQASKLKAQDFYFSISMCHGDDAPYHAELCIVHRHYFDTEGYVDSIHLESVVKKFFPKGIECYEEMESVFSIREELPADVLIAKFIEAGFIASSKLDKLIADVEADVEADNKAMTPLDISAASRALLLQAYPKADPQYWTPLSKHLNHQGFEVTVVYHAAYGQAWGIEETNEVTQDGWRHSLQDVSRLTPQDYWVSAIGDGLSCVRAFFVLKAYFSHEQQIEDVQLDCLEQHIPKDLGRLSIHEGSCVEFLEQTGVEAVMKALLASGFGYNEAFRKHVDSEHSA